LNSIIWIGDLLIIYQLKEREAQIATTAEAEKRWFEKKVLGKATRQVRDTLKYLKQAESIEVHNHRGHSFHLDIQPTHELHKLVVYLPNNSLPESQRQCKYHMSRAEGLIHIMAASDYLGIIQTLLTPSEVAAYLVFREALINKWQEEIAAVPEQALVGQYLDGNLNAQPSIKFIEYLQRLDHRDEEWDISGIISMFPDRVTTDNKPTDYYPIVRELALLKRSELREFKKRFQLSIEKAHANEIVLPYRLAIPRTKCGFVFIPVIKEMLSRRRDGLQNFTLANKYDLRLSKCIGVSIADDKDSWFTAEWCYIEFPWERDAEMEKMLKDNYPFRDVKQSEFPRYTYKDK
jgi:hypothetical protein